MRTLSLLRVLVLVSVLLACSGCYRIAYKVADRSGSTNTDERTLNYFLFGIVPTKDQVDSKLLCQGQRLLEVRTQQKPVNVLHAMLGGMLTSSYSVEAVCLKQSEEFLK